MLSVFGKNFKYVEELYYNVIKENHFGEFVELDDNQALKYLTDLNEMTGELCVITDLCYENERGPFIINSCDIGNFVNSFLDVFGESFYSTDIIIVSFREKLIWVLFHEGLCWLSKS